MENNLNLFNELKRLNSKILVTVEIITPEDARSFLLNNFKSKNVRNRKISSRTVNNYVNDIKNNRWKVGAPIVFDENEALIDGQTRCTAVIKAQKPILSLVVRGVDTNVFDSLDCGKRRTHKDVLDTLIFENKRLVKAAGVSAAIGLMFSVSKNHKAIDRNRGMLTNPEIFDMVKSDFNFYNEPYESGNIIRWRKNINSAISESILMAFYYTNKKKHVDLNNFLDTITSNDASTPLIVREFRDLMIYNKGKKSDERGYLSPDKIYFLIDTLFKYSQEKNGLINRKHFTKKDLQKIHE
jgi:hypothetical protein